MDDFVWWGTHAPMWQLYASMVLSGIALILLVLSMLPKRTRAHLWGKGDTAAKHLGSVKTVVVGYEEVPSHVIAVKNVRGEVTQNESDKILQDENGTKTDCLAKATSVASVDSPLPA
jgi:hypothetical protein